MMDDLYIYLLNLIRLSQISIFPIVILFLYHKLIGIRLYYFHANRNNKHQEKTLRIRSNCDKERVYRYLLENILYNFLECL